jgi:G6PDH family F420-dependent oxidoreductase
MRVHPAIVAQAAATTATMMPGRFLLGLGTGENLNEHVIGEGWPPGDIRLAMLEEALEVIRLLWKGGVQDHRGTYFRVDDAELFSLPDDPPQIMLAASKPKAAELAGRSADAIITTQIDRRLIERFERAGGEGKPRFVELSACWAADEARARRTAHEIWPLAALPGPLFTELAQPSHFEAAFSSLGEEEVAKNVLCGPDPESHVARIREAEAAGYTDVCVHQIGPEQEGFFRFYEREVLPRLRDTPRAASRSPRTLRAPRATRPSGRAAQKSLSRRRS